MAGVAALVAARQARATWGERLVSFGLELKRWRELRLSTAPRRLSLNGAQLELVSATSSLPVGEVLDRLEQVCNSEGGLVGTERAQQLLFEPVSVTKRLKPWLRDEVNDRGVLACLDTGGPLNIGALASRLRAFAQTGDLADVGALRYAFVERHGESTSILLLWTDGALPLKRMFPTVGDAPGRDPLGVPRGVGSRRLLSAVEAGAAYSFTAYQTADGTPAAALAFYRSALPPLGFALSDLGHDTVLARQGERALLLHAASAARGVAVSIGELR